MSAKADTEPTATRYTFRAAPGLKVSYFARGVFELVAGEQAATGEPVGFTQIANRSGISVPTVRRLLLGIGTFDAGTLQAIARAFGIERWSEVVALGMRVTELEMPAAIERLQRREAEGA